MNKFLTILKESLDFLSIVNYTIKIQLMKGLGGLGIGSQVFGMKYQGLGTGDWVVNNNRMLGIHYYQCPRGSNYLGYSLSHVKIKNMDNNRMQTSPRNPDHLSYQRHKKQQFWQILAPVGLGFLIMAAVIALMILTATKGDPGAQISGWADTSLIWLILPVLLVAILVAVLLFALVYLLARALKILPVYTGIAQQYAGLAADKIKYLSNRLVAPIISIKSSMAGVNKVVGKLVGHNKG